MKQIYEFRTVVIIPYENITTQMQVRVNYLEQTLTMQYYRWTRDIMALIICSKQEEWNNTAINIFAWARKNILHWSSLLKYLFLKDIMNYFLYFDSTLSVSNTCYLYM